MVKPACPWGHTRSAEALFSFVSQQPRSLFSPATDQPSTRDGQGASWATSSTDTTPARVRGLVLKKTAMVSFCFLLRQAADRQVLSKAKPPTVKTSKRYAIKITPHSADVPLLLSYFYLPYSLLPPCSRFVSLCAAPSHHWAVLTILRLARLCLVYGRLSSPVDPKDCTHTHTTYVSFLSGHNQPDLSWVRRPGTDSAGPQL